jgi:[protein-PII] uridylyltransferase
LKSDVFTDSKHQGNYKAHFPRTLEPVSDKDPAIVRDFATSLPSTYRAAFEVQAIAAHARLAADRGDLLANIGSFASSRAPGTPVCVIADDRPGLLATISAAIVMCGLDVVYAEAHTRRLPSGKAEAVDVFFLRHALPEQRKVRVSRQEIASLQETLIGLLEGRIDARGATPPRSSSLARIPSGDIGTVVRFIESGNGVLGTLEVETGDRSGLLLALSRALFEQRVQIVESEVKTVEHRVYDRFTVVELDGNPITPERRLQIQVAVLSAIEPTVERASQRPAAQRSAGR